MSDHLSTQELINRIESKDRRFRTAQAIFLILLLSLLIGVVFVQFRTLDTVRQQLVASKAQADENSKQSDKQREVIVRRLDCMVAFFSQPDRTTIRIADIEKCSLEKDDPAQFFAPVNGTSSTTTTNGDGSNTTTTTTNDTPGNPGATPSTTPPQSTNTPTPVPQPPVVEPRPPVEVLGLPVCVPFTGVCLR